VGFALFPEQKVAPAALAEIPSEPAGGVSTPIRAISTPIHAISTPIRAISTPIRAISTPIRVCRFCTCIVEEPAAPSSHLLLRNDLIITLYSDI